MTSPRSGRVERIRRALSERDFHVLHDLARVRLLTTHHIERLHFHDGSPLTRARRTRSLLQRLHAHDVVTRLERRVGGVHAGSAGFIYALSPIGQRLTNGLGPAGGTRLRKTWEPSLAFVDHMLAVSELYVQLRTHETDGHIEQLVFQAEPGCWRSWHGLGGEQLIVKPDAFVHFIHGDFEHAYFIEVDRATQSSTIIRRKGETYIDYYRSGMQQEQHGLFPQVLFVTTTDHRRSQITDALARLDAEHWRLFQVRRDDQAFTDLLRAPPSPS